jgi:DNA-binding MarR family transcriptional regulator
MSRADRDGADGQVIPSSAEPDQGEQLILWELVQTAHLATLAFRDVFADFGLTPTQFGVLYQLAGGASLTKAQLARAVLVSPQSMDPLIESLLAAGYVNRDGPARRGKAAVIRITQAGLKHLAVVRPAVDDLNSPDHFDLAPADVALLVQQLRVIRARLMR